MLDTDDARFRAGLERIRLTSERIAEARRQGGVAGALKRYAGIASNATTFLRLYTLPAKPNARPASSHLEPVW